jgi:hypothetical protein
VPTAPAPRPLSWRLLLLSALVVAATAVGGLRAVSLAQDRPGPHTLDVGDVSYTVTDVELVAGLTDQDLGGMSHGVQSLVGSGQALVRVRLRVSAGRNAAAYDPAALRAVAASSPASASGVAPSGASFAPGRLRAHGSIEGSLSYVLPRDGAQLVLRAGHARRSVALLRLDRAGSTTPEHAGHGGAPATAPSS